MGKLNLRQGAIGAVVVSMIASATAAARSDTPLFTFLYVAVVCLVGAGLGAALLIAIKRGDDSWRPRH